MNRRISTFVLALSLGSVLAIGGAGATQWQQYVIERNGASVDIPVSVFGESAGLSDTQLGRHFYTRDRRADLMVEAIPNLENDTPASFLAKKRPPSGIEYKRVTPRFFVVSSVRNGKIWYDRCNRSAGYMNCILINYPASEKRGWDGIVTRMSLSLRP